MLQLLFEYQAYLQYCWVENVLDYDKFNHDD